MTHEDWVSSVKEECVRTDWWELVHCYLLDHKDRIVHLGSHAHYLLAKYGLWNDELAAKRSR